LTCQPQEEWLTAKKAKAKAPPPGQRERGQLAIINFGQSGVLETPGPSIVEVQTEPEPQAASSGSAELEPQAGQVEVAQAPQSPKLQRLAPPTASGSADVLASTVQQMMQQMHQMEQGIDCKGEQLQVLSITQNKKERNHPSYLITLGEGRHRHIRRMLAALHVHIVTLKRISIGPLQLGRLKKGEWRFLSNTELKALQQAVKK